MQIIRISISIWCAATLLMGVANHAHADDLLGTLVPGHPRVMATQADFDRIKKLIQTDPLAKRWHADLAEDAQAMLDDPVSTRNIRDGRRLLYESRIVLRRVMTLALLDRLEPNDAYRERMWQDLQAVSQFKDWNPAHFLDVAEMALAFAIAYDWSHDRWTEAQKKTIRQAILRHALKPALKAYDNNDWWTRTHINWNQVCNGGLIAAAIAIADDQPDEARQLLGQAVKALRLPMKRYAPDGGYEEGPGYWSYGTLYNVIALASLESGLGTDFGLGDLPGFDQTGNFPLHMTGATGRGYNFGDGKARPVRSPAIFYLAKRFDQPGNAYVAAQRATGSPFDLLWYDPAAVDGDAEVLDQAVVYRSASVAALRSGWHDSDDWYIGAKGGWIGFGHSQMDLGSFVLEKQGVRWMIELGADDYNLPGYFFPQQGGQRWTYYRNRAEGQNTIVINPGKQGGQRYDAKVPIRVEDQTICVDMSSAYDGKVAREIALNLGTDTTTVTDRIELERPSEVWWFGHTMAKVSLSSDGRTATLRQDGQQMRVELLSPKGAAFTVMPAQPLASSPNPKGQNPNNGAKKVNLPAGVGHVKRGTLPAYGEPDPTQAIRKLAIKLEGVTQTTIQVKFSPLYH